MKQSNTGEVTVTTLEQLLGEYLHLLLHSSGKEDFMLELFVSAVKEAQTTRGRLADLTLRYHRALIRSDTRKAAYLARYLFSAVKKLNYKETEP